jgi:hypothetical protein
VKQRLSAKITTLLHHAPVVRNLARQKFAGQFIIALLKSRNVPFSEVAHSPIARWMGLGPGLGQSPGRQRLFVSLRFRTISV